MVAIKLSVKCRPGPTRRQAVKTVESRHGPSPQGLLHAFQFILACGTLGAMIGCPNFFSALAGFPSPNFVAVGGVGGKGTYFDELMVWGKGVDANAWLRLIWAYFVATAGFGSLFLYAYSLFFGQVGKFVLIKYYLLNVFFILVSSAASLITSRKFKKEDGLEAKLLFILMWLSSVLALLYWVSYLSVTIKTSDHGRRRQLSSSPYIKFRRYHRWIIEHSTKDQKSKRNKKEEAKDSIV